MPILTSDLARHFAPIYYSSSEEYQYLVLLENDPNPQISLCHPPWKPCIYYSIFKWSPIDNQDFYETNYLSIWDRDTGIRGHLWDTERMALLVKSPAGATNLSQFEIHETYFAAHEGEGLFNRSKYVELSNSDKRIEVYWSLDKHGSYSSLKDAKKYLFIEGFKKPGNKADPTQYALIDVGTIDHPIAPWIKYPEPWGPDNVSPVYSKLKNRIWSPIPGTSKWKRNLPGEKEARTEIRKFQSALNLPITGKISKKLYGQVNSLPREVIRNTPMMDESIIGEILKLQPRQLDADQVAAAFDVPAKSMSVSKTIAGSIEGVTGAETIILGKINSRNVLYGLINPKDGKIFAIKKAPIGTLKHSIIDRNELRKP